MSVDTKKKELVGLFKNPGAARGKEPSKVNDHDFRSDGKGMAVPFGVHDLRANRGYVSVGMNHDAPEFAVHAAMWLHKQTAVLQRSSPRDIMRQ